MTGNRDLTRRDLLGALGVLVAGGVVGGCTRGSGGGRSTAPSPNPTTSSTPTAGAAATRGATAMPPDAGTASPSPGGRLPRTTRWTAHPGEVRPDVKAGAVRLVEGVGKWTGETERAHAYARARQLGATSAAADGFRPLLGGGSASVVQIVDAQYGGILTSSASVLVVVNQWVERADGTVHAGGTTFDIRLEAASPKWRITAVNPADPGPAASSISRAARRVLADDRISLPYAAAADVGAGTIHDSVLHGLLSLAGSHRIEVSVLRSGHPPYVFGTNRRSDHPRGRAADIWAFDGLRIVEPRNRARVEAFMREASRTGTYQVGGPVDLDGAGLAYFSDNTHQDHVHLGYLS